MERECPFSLASSVEEEGPPPSASCLNLKPPASGSSDTSLSGDSDRGELSREEYSDFLEDADGASTAGLQYA